MCEQRLAAHERLLTCSELEADAGAREPVLDEHPPSRRSEANVALMRATLARVMLSVARGTEVHTSAVRSAAYTSLVRLTDST